MGLREGCVFSDLAVGEKGPLGLHKGSDFSSESQTIVRRSCIKDVVERLEASLASISMCSCVVFIDEVLVAEANRFPRSFSLSSLGLLDFGCWSLKMLFQDGSLVETLGSAEKDPSGKVVMARVEELEALKALEFACVLEREVMDSLSSKFVNFSSFVGMLVEGFEKEISSLLKKLVGRKGNRVKV